MTILDLRSYDPTADDLPLRGTRHPRLKLRSPRPRPEPKPARKVLRALKRKQTQYSEDEQACYEDAAYLAELKDEQNMGGAMIDFNRGWHPYGGDAA